MGDSIAVAVTNSDAISIQVGGGDNVACSVDGDRVSTQVNDSGDINVQASEQTIGVTLQIGNKEALKKDTFTGDGLTSEFTLSFTPRVNSLLVWVQGVLQEEDVEYALSGKVITFNENPKANRKILAFYIIN